MATYACRLYDGGRSSVLRTGSWFVNDQQSKDNTKRAICSQIPASLFFFWITQYNADAHNTYVHSPLRIHVYANPTPMSTSEGLSTGKYGDSRSHQWHLIADGNVTYHLTHNADKSWKIQKKVQESGFEPWWVASHWTVLQLNYKPNCNPRFIISMWGWDSFNDLNYWSLRLILFNLHHRPKGLSIKEQWNKTANNLVHIGKIIWLSAWPLGPCFS
jgi:hypothetical protein